jgi:hypothetical protein
MLKTTKRFLGQQRFERLSKVFWCENFATDGESKPERRSASLQHQPWLHVDVFVWLRRRVPVRHAVGRCRRRSAMAR